MLPDPQLVSFTCRRKLQGRAHGNGVTCHRIFVGAVRVLHGARKQPEKEEDSK